MSFVAPTKFRRYKDGSPVHEGDIVVMDDPDNPYYYGRVGVIEIRGPQYETVYVKNGSSYCTEYSYHLRKLGDRDRIGSTNE